MDKIEIDLKAEEASIIRSLIPNPIWNWFSGIHLFLFIGLLASLLITVSISGIFEIRGSIVGYILTILTVLITVVLQTKENGSPFCPNKIYSLYQQDLEENKKIILSFHTNEYIEIEEDEDEGRKIIFKISPTKGLHVCSQEFYDDVEENIIFPKENLHFEYSKNARIMLSFSSLGNQIICTNTFNDYSDIGIVGCPDDFEVIDYNWSK